MQFHVVVDVPDFLFVDVEGHLREVVLTLPAVDPGEVKHRVSRSHEPVLVFEARLEKLRVYVVKVSESGNHEVVGGNVARIQLDVHVGEVLEPVVLNGALELNNRLLRHFFAF